MNRLDTQTENDSEPQGNSLVSPHAIALIPLANGEFATIDKEDEHLARRYNWNVSVNGYIATGTGRKETQQYLHHLIAGEGDCPSGNCEFVLHMNRDKLDNRKSNLRLASRSQSNAFRKRRADNKSGLKGVSWDRSRKMWLASTSLNGRRIYLGRYHSKEAAAEAYNEAALTLFGEFACVNDGDQG